MSSATVGIARPQVVSPPMGGVFGKREMPAQAIGEKKRKPLGQGGGKKSNLKVDGGKSEKVGKIGKPSDSMDPMTIMGVKKPKKENK